MYEKEHPDVRIRLEPSGSQVAARKLADHGMSADLVAVADADVINRILVPRHARFNAVFATNEIVIAHKDHSAFTTEITAGNWPSVLRRPSVRIGRADPDTAPIGYHTLFVWQLAERSGTYGDSAENLMETLIARCAEQHVVHDEAELLAQLESKALDYVFLYRSTAEDHHLKITLLPPDQSLSRADFAVTYASASVDIPTNQHKAKVHIVGAPVTYGLTIPLSAPHGPQAAQFVAFLFAEAGRGVFERRGFRPLNPVQCKPCDGAPAEVERWTAR